MNFIVYIIYSEKLAKFYIGTTDNFEERLSKHNTGAFDDSFTIRGKPWQEFMIITGLSSHQAYLIEKHIKRMKSKKYILNLKTYPEIIVKLKEKYS